MYGTDPDRQFWQRAQQGDAGAYDQLRRKYWAMVIAEIRKRLHHVNSDELQDLAQNVWMAVWTSLPQFRGASTFSTWLVGIAKNMTFQSIRRRKAEEQAVTCAVYDMSSRGEKEAESHIVTHIAIHETIRNLPESEREVIQLRYFAQLTDEEVSLRLQVPLGTVKSRIRAGLAKLKHVLSAAEGAALQAAKPERMKAEG